METARTVPDSVKSSAPITHACGSGGDLRETLRRERRRPAAKDADDDAANGLAID